MFKLFKKKEKIKRELPPGTIRDYIKIVRV